jgi:hypothetical protein
LIIRTTGDMSLRPFKLECNRSGLFWLRSHRLEIEDAQGRGVREKVDANYSAAAHGEVEHRHWATADRHDRSCQTVDKRELGSLGPASKDSGDSVDTVHHIAQLWRTRIRSCPSDVDCHGVSPQHHVGIEQPKKRSEVPIACGRKGSRE